MERTSREAVIAVAAHLQATNLLGKCACDVFYALLQWLVQFYLRVDSTYFLAILG